MTCPIHNLPLAPVQDEQWGGKFVACPAKSCGYTRIAPKTPQRAAERPQQASQKLPKAREEDIQQAIIQTLRIHGYEVLQTTVRVRKCEKCGTYPTKARYGATDGVPDLFVWVEGAWRGIEVKGPATKISDAQKRLAEKGRVVIVRSVEDALEAIRMWKGY